MTENGFDRSLLPKQHVTECCGEPSLDLDFALGIIGESATWVTEVCLWEHEWVMDTDVILKENEMPALFYEIEVFCPLW